MCASLNNEDGLAKVDSDSRYKVDKKQQSANLKNKSIYFLKTFDSKVKKDFS